MDHSLIDYVITIVVAMFASSGFWALLEFKIRNRSKIDKDREMQLTLLKGLAHDRIVYLGMKYIQRGWITTDEYENLCVYLYQPYIAMSGNGSALKIMDELNKLPIRPSIIGNNKEFTPN